MSDNPTSNDPTSKDPTSNDPTSKDPTSKDPASNDPATNNSTNRRRTLVALIIAFLVIGGGIFTFLIFQGLGDLKGDNKGTFSYGFAARNIILPLSNYFSLSDDLGVARRTGEKLKVKGAEPSLLDGPAADISDWMKKGEAGTNTGAGAGRASSAPPQPGGRTAVPRMGGGLGSAVGGGGSGGSKSSGSPSKFSSGSDASNTSVTGTQGGRGGPQGRSGTLNALASARASLSDGLKSGSAMTAKAKWDQGFGVGNTGKKTGDMAYGKSGLVGLDHIKSGDIADLKMTGAQTLKTAEPTPEKDKASEAKDSNLAKMAGKEGADAANKAMTDAVGNVAKNNDKSAPGGSPKVELPPQSVIDLATTKPPKGTFCPDGCGEGGNAYKDSKVSYYKDDKGWNAVYEGDQGGKAYRDVMTVDPTKPEGQQVQPVGSLINNNGTWTKTTQFGGTEPIETTTP